MVDEEHAKLTSTSQQNQTEYTIGCQDKKSNKSQQIDPLID
ncbi:MAG TPA: hypothetical protein VIY08_16185 [Candidatus Nitrosocosmicus sp.]